MLLSYHGAMLLRRLLLSLVSVALVLLVVELWIGLGSEGEDGGARPTFEPSAEQRERWSRRLERLRRIEAGEAEPKADRLVGFSARYGWVTRPGVAGELAGDRISLNALAARSTREFGDAPPEGVLRVACYGESFTFCTEVDDDEDWPAQLEATAGGDLEVINLGVMGWGTDQALLRFRDSHGDLAPNVVLLGLMAENIQRNVNRVVQVRAAGERLPMVKPRFLVEDGDLRLLPQPYATELELYEAAVSGSLTTDLAEHEWLVGAPDGGSWSGLASTLKVRRERARRARWWEQWSEPEGEPYRVTLALVEAFHAEATAAGARLAAVVLFPAKPDLEDAGRRLTGLRSALDERGIAYLDTYDLLLDRRSRGLDTFANAHLTAGANGAVAEAVHAFLEDRLSR